MPNKVIEQALKIADCFKNKVRNRIKVAIANTKGFHIQHNITECKSRIKALPVYRMLILTLKK